MTKIEPGYKVTLAAHRHSLITGRDGATLACHYGFESVQALADSIPRDTEVVDVGAGFSTLGHEVAKLRDDIHWTNFDVAYGWDGEDRYAEQQLVQLALNAPDNLSYQEGDILLPPTGITEARFSRIFSYFMLPYLLHYDRSGSYVKEAISNMLKMGEQGGTMNIGPMGGGMNCVSTAIVPSNPKKFDKLSGELSDAFSKDF